jgi:hypothetical protein
VIHATLLSLVEEDPGALIGELVLKKPAVEVLEKGLTRTSFSQAVETTE